MTYTICAALVVGLVLMTLSGCGEPSAAEMAAREDAALWRGLALCFAVVALVVGIVIGVSAAKRGDAADQTVPHQRGADDQPQR